MRKNTLEQKINYAKILVFGSLIGLTASFLQATERITMLKNPGGELSCNLNPVVDCGSVLGNNLAAVFGPPNAFIGMVVFTLLLAFGLQLISGGSWTSLVAKVAIFFSILIFGFSIWFFGVSLYVIGKICIFCIFIWFVSIPIGIYGLKDYLENKKKLGSIGKSTNKVLQKYHFSILVAIYAVMITLYFLKFQEYYFN
jgi:uncharacterized membrane protein